MLDCKKALGEADGDVEKALRYPAREGPRHGREEGRTRAAADGAVGAYIHAGGKIGVLIEVNCETDFVARTDEFQALVRDLAMQVAAASPRYVQPRGRARRTSSSSEREIYRAQAAQQRQAGAGHREDRRRQGREVLHGRLPARAAVHQADATARSASSCTDAIAQLGENIAVRRFARFQLGESLDQRLRQGEPRWRPARSLSPAPASAGAGRYRRVLLKLSGEALAGQAGYGIDPAVLAELRAPRSATSTRSAASSRSSSAAATSSAASRGSARGIDRATGDYMGMLATVINALALQDALEKLGVPTRVLSAIEMQPGRRALHPPPRHAPPREGARRHLRRRHRQPVLHHRHRRQPARRWRSAPRSSSRRPRSTASTTPTRRRTPTRVRFDELTYIDVLNRQLQVMDATAISLCMDNVAADHGLQHDAAGEHHAGGQRASASGRSCTGDAS